MKIPIIHTQSTQTPTPILKIVRYADAFTKVMLDRAQVDDQEIFAVKGISREELHAQMVKNMCLGQVHHKARMFRETTARINEDHYLKDEIRKQSNGGHKFHPYL